MKCLKASYQEYHESIGIAKKEEGWVHYCWGNNPPVVEVVLPNHRKRYRSVLINAEQLFQFMMMERMRTKP